MVTKDDGFESIFNKAKNTTNRFQDWEFVMTFCDRVNEEPEGPPAAIKVLADKLKTQDETTQLLAIAVLEACVKNCGAKFHVEVGKFKLLNELIKLISPKYSGNISSEQLKAKVRSLFFQWRRGLPKQGKIMEAFEMLKKEGLIDDEGNIPETPPPPIDDTPRDSIIKDEKEIETLEKLLKSKNPQDLVKANEMIQDRYKKENYKLEKLQHRSRELDLVENNAKLLDELLGHYSATSSQSETDLIEELKKSCVAMREKLLKIAEQCTEDDTLLNKVCTSSDGLFRVLEKYDKVTTEITEHKQKLSKDIPSLISSPPHPPAAQQNTNNTESILDSLIELDLTTPVRTTNPIAINTHPDISSLLDDFGPFNSVPINSVPSITPPEADDVILFPPAAPVLLPPSPTFNLDAFTVTNNSVQICPVPAVIPYNRDNVVLSLSTGRAISPPTEAPDLKLVVIALINLSPFGIENFVLNAAAPKDSNIKLFQPSQQSILPFTPLQSPPSINQILAIETEHTNLLLKLKFSLSIGGRQLTEIIDVSDLKWL